jgi:hypothetical protein
MPNDAAHQEVAQLAPVARRGSFVGDDQFDIVFIPSAPSALVTPAAGDDPEVAATLGVGAMVFFCRAFPTPVPS